MITSTAPPVPSSLRDSWLQRWVAVLGLSRSGSVSLSVPMSLWGAGGASGAPACCTVEGTLVHIPAPPWLSPAAGQPAQASPFRMAFVFGRLTRSFQAQIPESAVSEVLTSARQPGPSSPVTSRSTVFLSSFHFPGKDIKAPGALPLA